MKIDEILEADIISLGINGEGIARVDGVVVFVPNALVGERAKIKIEKIEKNYAIAKLEKMLVASSSRQDAPCPYFYECGGCQIQHMNYDTQLDFKRNKVSETIEKFLHKKIEIEACQPSLKEYGYRNKIELNFSKNGLGYFDKNNKKIININNCLIFDNKNELFNKIIFIFNKFAENNKKYIYEKNNNGIIKSLIIRQIDNIYVFTLVLFKQYKFDYENIFEQLDKLKIDYSFFVSINEIKNSSNITSRLSKLKGESLQVINFDGIKQFISPNSFLQINNGICRSIYEKICEWTNEQDVVIDAYSGAGLLSAIIAKKAKYVYGVEIVENAVKDANKLAENNGIKNIQNFCGNCAKFVDSLVKEKKMNSIILDPPRKGCDKEVLEAILNSQIDKVIYLSCNVATLSRDLVLLTEKYDIKEIIPYDMFPQTCQVETLVQLKRK